MQYCQLVIGLLSGLLLTSCLASSPQPSVTSEPDNSSVVEIVDFGMPADPSAFEAFDPPVPGDSSISGEKNDSEDLLIVPLADVAIETAFIDQEELLDEETLADNRVLQGDDQMPPDDPGEILPHVEPVFDFPVVENEKVRYFVDYYSGPAKKTFALWLERSGRYLPMMQEIFAEAGLPRDLAYLAMVESGFNDKAYSWAHAVGPWQFIASTGHRYGLNSDWWHDERRDPEKATRAAARFLADLYDDFDGDWYLAVASYNAGPGKLRNAIKRYKTRDFWELCRGKYLQTETKHYLPKLLAALLIAKQPEKYGFTELDYQPPLEYDTAMLPSTTDLEVIARLTGADYQLIKKLNPELKRWSTPPGVEDYQVRLPAGSQEEFLAKYAELPERQRANYVRHKVKSGDTLLALAKRYGVRVQDIKNLNRIRNTRAIQIGTNLIIPLNPDANGSTALASLGDDYKRSQRTYYTVRSGDSLWKISRKFSVSEKQLRVWNRLGWTNVIRPGQRLVVSAKAAPTKKVAAVKNTGPLQKMVYEVRPGDTLWAIGREFSVAASQIRQWNNLSENHVLQPGEQLTLHVSSEGRG